MPRLWLEEGVESCGVRATDGPPTAILRAIVVGNDRHGEAQGVTGRRAWSTP